MCAMEACPYLPPAIPGKPVNHGPARGAGFYMDALSFAQAYWIAGKPAQAILQLNRAFSADLSDEAEILREWPWP